MSQIIRATFVSPSFQGMTWNVSGSGIATMSDSSIALNPVIDDPSKPIPSSSASSISLGVTAKLFRCPSMSVNQRSRNSIPASLIRPSTFLRASGSLVALGLLSTCATDRPPFKTQKPRTLQRPRPHRLRTSLVYRSRERQLTQLGLAALMRDRAAVEAERRPDRKGPGRQRGPDSPDVAEHAENRPAAGLSDRVRLAGDREDRRPNARVGDLLAQPRVVKRPLHVAGEEDAEQPADRDPRRARESEEQHRRQLQDGEAEQELRNGLPAAVLDAPDQAADRRHVERHPRQPEDSEPDD